MDNRILALVVLGKVGPAQDRNTQRPLKEGKKYRERKISPKFFRPKFFHGRPRGMSVPKCLFFQDLEGLTEVFGRMSAGISGKNFLFGLNFRS